MNRMVSEPSEYTTEVPAQPCQFQQVGMRRIDTIGGCAPAHSIPALRLRQGARRQKLEVFVIPRRAYVRARMRACVSKDEGSLVLGPTRLTLTYNLDAHRSPKTLTLLTLGSHHPRK